MIGIIAAMDIEAKKLTEALIDPQKETVLGVGFTKGRLSGKDVVIAVCGIGKVNAAVCTAIMIEKFLVTALFSVGVAGSISERTHLLDVCIARSVCQHDFDTCAFGDKAGQLPGFSEVHIACDEKLIDALYQAALRHGEAPVVCKMACGDQFIATKGGKLRIHEAFGTDACEMESGAIGQVAYQNNIPFVVMRVISDSLSDDSTMDYEQFKEKAAEKVLIAADAIAAL